DVSNFWDSDGRYEPPASPPAGLRKAHPKRSMRTRVEGEALPAEAENLDHAGGVPASGGGHPGMFAVRHGVNQLLSSKDQAETPRPRSTSARIGTTPPRPFGSSSSSCPHRRS